MSKQARNLQRYHLNTIYRGCIEYSDLTNIIKILTKHIQKTEYSMAIQILKALICQSLIYNIKSINKSLFGLSYLLETLMTNQSIDKK